MDRNYKRIGDYIREVKVRNTNDERLPLLGINIDKYYMPSVANIVGTDLSTYKIVTKGQFACNRMHVGRDKRLPVALSANNDKFIVSPAYDVFEITNLNNLLPEYLMMWFSRKEFDRNSWFYTDADVRGGLSWSSFCDMRLPVPDMATQRAIVTEYNTVQNRINLNNQLIRQLEATAQAIYKQWFVDFEFPDAEGKPYKSNGGEMVKSEMGEVPKGWRVGRLGDIIQLQRGFDLPSQNRQEGKYPIYASTGISQYHTEYKVKAPCVVTGRSGSLGEVFYIDEDFWPLNTTLWVKEFKDSSPIFAYYTLRNINISDYNDGSAVPTLNRNAIHLHQILIPSIETIERFDEIQMPFFKNTKLMNKELSIIGQLKELLLSKMVKGG